MTAPNVAEVAWSPTRDWIESSPDDWRVLHTRSRNEKMVANILARSDVPHYLPLAPVERTYAKSRVTFHIPLFPGYVFMCGDGDACEIARETNRVANIIPVYDQAQLRSELSQISAALASERGVEPFPGLGEGRQCRITGGSLKGLEGVVVRRGSRYRMVLLVTILGQAVAVEVDAALLEPID